MHDFCQKHRNEITWCLRLIVGATFIVSGVAKAIDVWGFVYKMEQYLAVWGIEQPRELLMVASMSISSAEFLLGLFLATGCYRRVATWLLMLMMAFMLPLTVYIAIANPVSDCGCFGDFLHISNVATLIKNIVIVAMLVYLLRHNRHVAGLFTVYSQWVVVVIAAAYILLIGLYGYCVQPLIDFRSFPRGTQLAPNESATNEPSYEFIYEKQGERRQFPVDSLPDSTWAFVDRIVVAGTEDDPKGAFIINDDTDADITTEIISTSGQQVLLLIPELNRVDVSSTFTINELNRFMSSQGGSVVAILGEGADAIERWRDISLATYDIYHAEPTAIKAVARGNIAVVLLDNGIIKWKRSMSAIDSDAFSSPSASTMSALKPFGPRFFWVATALDFLLLAILYVIDRSGRAVNLHLSRKKAKK